MIIGDGAYMYNINHTFLANTLSLIYSNLYICFLSNLLTSFGTVQTLVGVLLERGALKRIYSIEYKYSKFMSKFVLGRVRDPAWRKYKRCRRVLGYHCTNAIF